MSLLTTSAALALLTAAPASPAPSDDFRLHPGLPAGFVADGKLDEWKLPPSATLGAASQVAGNSKVASPDDFSAKVWAALGPEGLAVAGEVRDERVLFPEKPGDLSADHVEVWLALPQPVMPPIAFVNQFGEQPLPTAAACSDVPDEQEALPQVVEGADGAPQEARAGLHRAVRADARRGDALRLEGRGRHHALRAHCPAATASRPSSP